MGVIIDYSSYIAKYYSQYTAYKEFIVVHYTANTGTKATARGNANYFANCDRQASAHFTVDENEAYCCVPETMTAYAVGGTLYPATLGGSFYGRCTNANSISIEMVSHTDENGAYFIPQQTIDNALELVKMLQDKYGISNDHVIRHYDVNGKPCPWCWTTLNGYTEDAWIVFKERLETDAPSTNPLYRVQVGAFSSYYNALNYLDTVNEAGFKVYEPFVVLINGLWKVQVGAFQNYGYAVLFRDTLRNAGFDGAFLTEAQSANKQFRAVTDDVVVAVIRGEYGNGNNRKVRLESEGYNYEEVTKAVNKRLAS